MQALDPFPTESAELDSHTTLNSLTAEQRKFLNIVEVRYCGPPVPLSEMADPPTIEVVCSDGGADAGIFL